MDHHITLRTFIHLWNVPESRFRLCIRGSKEPEYSLVFFGCFEYEDEVIIRMLNPALLDLEVIRIDSTDTDEISVVLKGLFETCVDE